MPEVAGTSQKSPPRAATVNEARVQGMTPNDGNVLLVDQQKPARKMITKRTKSTSAKAAAPATLVGPQASPATGYPISLTTLRSIMAFVTLVAYAGILIRSVH